MEKIFLNLLTTLTCYGELTEVCMYESGHYSTITIKNESGEYTVSITKKEVVKND